VPKVGDDVTLYCPPAASARSAKCRRPRWATSRGTPHPLSRTRSRTPWGSRCSSTRVSLAPECLTTLDNASRNLMVSYAGQPMGTSLLDVLLHVCTHAHYTAAQAINILRHLGVSPLPDPMLITLARQEP
jgi:hypothetical protein